MSKPETKTEPSQVQHEDMWARMTQDGIARMQAFYDELAVLEGKAYSRAKQTAEQFQQLASETVTYLNDLAAEWRKVTLEATRRSTEMFRPRA